MRLARFLLPVLVLGILAFAPHPAFAAETSFFGPIFPEACACPGSAPDFKCVGAIIQNLVNFAFSIGVVIFILVCAYAGALFMASPVNPHGREQGRKALMSAVVGLLIALSAWLIVDFVMSALYRDPGDWGPWNSILEDDKGEHCLVPVTPAGAPKSFAVGDEVSCRLSGAVYDGSIKEVRSGGSVLLVTFASRDEGTVPAADCGEIGSIVATPGTTRGISCANCVSLSSLGLSCKSASSCTADSSFASKLDTMSFSGSWRVTEAFPPTYTHRAVCHRNGTCIDAGFTGTSYTAANIETFANAAKSVGLCVVFETKKDSLRDQVRAKGVVAHSSSEGGGYESITGDHFSVYSNAGDCH